MVNLRLPFVALIAAWLIACGGAQSTAGGGETPGGNTGDEADALRDSAIDDAMDAIVANPEEPAGYLRLIELHEAADDAAAAAIAVDAQSRFPDDPTVAAVVEAVFWRNARALPWAEAWLLLAEDGGAPARPCEADVTVAAFSNLVRNADRSPDAITLFDALCPEHLRRDTGDSQTRYTNVIDRALYDHTGAGRFAATLEIADLFAERGFSAFSAEKHRRVVALLRRGGDARREFSDWVRTVPSQNALVTELEVRGLWEAAALSAEVSADGDASEADADVWVVAASNWYRAGDDVRAADCLRSAAETSNDRLSSAERFMSLTGVRGADPEAIIDATTGLLTRVACDEQNNDRVARVEAALYAHSDFSESAGDRISDRYSTCPNPSAVAHFAANACANSGRNHCARSWAQQSLQANPVNMAMFSLLLDTAPGGIVDDVEERAIREYIVAADTLTESARETQLRSLIDRLARQDDRGALTAATDALVALRRRRPQDAATAIELARLFEASEDFEAADQVFVSLTQANPSIETLAIVARHYTTRRAAPDARVWTERLTDAASTDTSPPPFSWHGTDTVRQLAWRMHLANVARDADVDAVAEALEQIAQDSANPAMWRELWSDRSVRDALSGRARVVFVQRVIEGGFDSVETQTELGRAANAVGDDDVAVAAFIAAVRHDPTQTGPILDELLDANRPTIATPLLDARDADQGVDALSLATRARVEIRLVGSAWMRARDSDSVELIEAQHEARARAALLAYEAAGYAPTQLPIDEIRGAGFHDIAARFGRQLLATRDTEVQPVDVALDAMIAGEPWDQLRPIFSNLSSERGLRDLRSLWHELAELGYYREALTVVEAENLTSQLSAEDYFNDLDAIGDLYISVGDRQGATEFARRQLAGRALALTNGDAELDSEILQVIDRNTFAAAFFHRAASIAMQVGSFDEAHRWARRALQTNGFNDAPMGIAIAARAIRGTLSFDDISAIVGDAGGGADAWAYAATRVLTGGDIVLAERVFAHAIDLDPTQTNVLRGLVRCAALLGDVEAAQRWHERAMGVAEALRLGDEEMLAIAESTIQSLRLIGRHDLAFDLIEGSLTDTRYIARLMPDVVQLAVHGNRTRRLRRIVQRMPPSSIHTDTIIALAEYGLVEDALSIWATASQRLQPGDNTEVLRVLGPHIVRLEGSAALARWIDGLNDGSLGALPLMIEGTDALRSSGDLTGAALRREVLPAWLSTEAFVLEQAAMQGALGYDERLHFWLRRLLENTTGAQSSGEPLPTEQIAQILLHSGAEGDIEHMLDVGVASGRPADSARLLMVHRALASGDLQRAMQIVEALPRSPGDGAVSAALELVARHGHTEAALELAARLTREAPSIAIDLSSVRIEGLAGRESAAGERAATIVSREHPFVAASIAHSLADGGLHEDAADLLQQTPDRWRGHWSQSIRDTAGRVAKIGDNDRWLSRFSERSEEHDGEFRYRAEETARMFELAERWDDASRILVGAADALPGDISMAIRAADAAFVAGDAAAVSRLISRIRWLSADGIGASSSMISRYGAGPDSNLSLALYEGAVARAPGHPTTISHFAALLGGEEGTAQVLAVADRSDCAPGLMTSVFGVLRSRNADTIAHALWEHTRECPRTARVCAAATLAMTDPTLDREALACMFAGDNGDYVDSVWATEIALREGYTDLALAAFERFAELAPDSPLVNELRGRVALASGNIEAAVAAFDQFVSLRSGLVHTRDGRFQTHSGLPAIISELAASDSPELSWRYADVLVTLPIPGLTEGPLGGVYLTLQVFAESNPMSGVEYFRARHPEVLDNPDIGAGSWLVAHLYDRAGMVDHAIAAHELALLLNPNNTLTLNNFAYLLADRNIQLDRGAMLAGRSLALDEDMAPATLDTSAWIHFRQGELERARDELMTALRQAALSGYYVQPDDEYLQHIREVEEAIAARDRGVADSGSENESRRSRRQRRRESRRR